MEVLFLGTGTAFGIPMIGCRCPTCRSSEPRNKRLRSSILITLDGKNLLVDTSTDLRQQALLYGIERIDGCFFTHAHADHLHGLDEVRRFNVLQGGPIDAYATHTTIEVIRRTFFYMFEKSELSTGMVPEVRLHEVNGPFTLFGHEILPLEVRHGHLPITAYRIADFAYVTDASSIPEESQQELKGLDLLVLNALRDEPHPAHFSLSQALAIVRNLKPRRAYLTHLSHEVEHVATQKLLPRGVKLAYDGLRLKS